MRQCPTWWQQVRLSGDAAALNTLLPRTLNALDWCLAQIASGSGGLVRAPLNDLSSDPQLWAFNQAYFFAGLEELGRALATIGHPRAAECTTAAATLKLAIERSFAQASAASPLAQLRDRTWSPFVPGDALTPRLTPEIWYPTDVDTGPLHLARLGAIDPHGALTTRLLQDHEDNLFLRGWGLANEPVYNQHALALLERDEVKPVIRAFYSMMACAFSHSTFEPVEHRRGWGQYFGPPSTDGAWFELYRKMLVREQGDGSLLCGQAAPRAWPEQGKRIDVERAPTFFGLVDFHTESRSGTGELEARVHFGGAQLPATLLVRLRHPTGMRMQRVTVNGVAWADFDGEKEWVRIANPAAADYTIIATYAPQTSGFDLWRAQVFTPAQMADSSVSGAAAAPAGDGLGNFAKYALGFGSPFLPAVESAAFSIMPASAEAITLHLRRAPGDDLRSAHELRFTVLGNDRDQPRRVLWRRDPFPACRGGEPAVLSGRSPLGEHSSGGGRRASRTVCSARFAFCFSAP